MFLQALDHLSTTLVPIRWPIFILLASMLGTAAVLFLTRVTRDGSPHSVDLREGGLGFALFVGIAATLLWIGLLCWTYKFPDTDPGSDIFSTLVSPSLQFIALTAVGIVYGAGWFGFAASTVAVCNIVYHLVTSPRRRVERADEARKLQTERERSEREADERRRRDRDHEQLSALAQQKREDARLSCDLLYDRLSTEQQARFPRDRIHAYFTKYLGDSLMPDQIAERAGRLEAMLQEFLRADSGDKPRFQNLIDIREFYQHERLRIIDGPNIDEDFKETLLADLSREEELSIREFRQR